MEEEDGLRLTSLAPWKTQLWMQWAMWSRARAGPRRRHLPYGKISLRWGQVFILPEHPCKPSQVHWSTSTVHRTAASPLAQHWGLNLGPELHPASFVLFMLLSLYLFLLLFFILFSFTTCWVPQAGIPFAILLPQPPRVLRL